MTELTGKKLGIAVARKVMRWTEYGVGNDYPIFVLESPDKRWRQWSGWRSMDDAWEVDREGWLWQFEETRKGLEVYLLPNQYGAAASMRTAIRAHPKYLIRIFLRWSKVPDKRIAYALGRCQAALKAVRGDE
jgi:hypothetical protein